MSRNALFLKPVKKRFVLFVPLGYRKKATNNNNGLFAKLSAKEIINE